jgi:hypothetical protein
MREWDVRFGSGLGLGEPGHAVFWRLFVNVVVRARWQPLVQRARIFGCASCCKNNEVTGDVILAAPLFEDLMGLSTFCTQDVCYKTNSSCVTVSRWIKVD